MLIRVLSYNIHKGFGPGNWSFVLGRIREVIREVGADLVLLQEVQGRHDKHVEKREAYPPASQFEFLADRVWSHYAYGKNAVYTHGHHGNAILSKFPIRAWENLDVSNNRLEQRGILHAVIEVPGSKIEIHAVTLHLDLLKRGRRRQLERLCERIRASVPAGSPLIIAGDFNDWTRDATPILNQELRTFEVFQVFQGAHARTFPSRLPVLALDRIYARDLRIQNARVLDGHPWRRLSDHLALTCDLEIVE